MAVTQPFQLDLRSLALFRVAAGVMLIVDILNRFPDVRAHYSDFGTLPRYAMGEIGQNTTHLSIYMISGHWTVAAALFCLSMLISALLIVGYRTRLMVALSWFMLVSIHSRNGIVLQAGDVLLRLLLFWSFFLPLNARFSVDAALAKGNAHREKTKTSGIPCAAYMLQVAFVYWIGVALKSASEWWPDLTAVHYALHLDQYATHLAIWLRQFPDVLKGLTAATLLAETLLPALWFLPVGAGYLRGFSILGLAFMHLSFFACLRIGQFPFINLLSFVPLIPSSFWSGWKRLFIARNKEPISLEFLAESRVASIGLAIAKELLLLPSTRVKAVTAADRRPEMAERDWIVITATDQVLSGRAAVAAFVRSSPVLAWVPARLLLDALHPLARAFRPRLTHKADEYQDKLSKAFPTRESPRVTPSWQVQVMAMAFLAYCTVWNLSGLKRFSAITMPPNLTWVGSLFRLDQHWSMFAPKPKQDSGWLVIPGTLRNGRAVDVFNRKLEPASFDKPKYVSDTWISQRWRKYLLNLTDTNTKDYLLHFGRYLCRSWNEDKAEADSLDTFQVFYVQQMIQPDHLSEPVRLLKWSHFCFDRPVAGTTAQASAK